MDAPSPGPGAPFVGRADLVARAAAGVTGPGRGVAIIGPAGQGKTRLAREVLDRLAGDGRVTAVVVGSRAAATIPLGALAAVLPPAADRAASLTDLVARAIRAVAGLGGDEPPVVLFDDAHLLDPATATVLHQLATTAAAVPVLTVRTGEEAPDAVTALWKDGVVDRIDLSPLTEAETGALAAALAGGPLSASAVRTLWETSGGNPLVAGELVRGATEDGALAAEQGVWRFTRRLRPSARLAELVADRLGALPAPAREVVEVLAVGEPLPLRLLTDLTTDATVVDLERRGTVTVEPGPGGATRLAHPLYGEVVREAMGVAQVAAVSRRLAGAATSGSVAVDPVRAATWQLDGGGDLDGDLLLRAARQAFFAHDDALADRLSAAAVAAGAGIDGLVLRGQVLVGTGRHEDVEALFRPADLARATDPQRVAVARCRSFASFWGLGRAAPAMAVLRETEAALVDDGWRQEVRAERAVFSLLAGDLADALTTVEPLLRSPAERAMVTAAIAGVIGMALDGRNEAAVALADRALAVHLGLGDQEALAQPGMHLVGKALALQEAGRLAEAEALCADGHAAATDLSLSSGQAWFLLLGGRVDLLRGRVARAGRRFGEAAGLFAGIGEHGPRRWALAGCALAAGLRGDGAGAAEALAAVDSTPPVAMTVMQPELDRARAWHLVASGDHEAAVARLHAAADGADRMGSPPLAAAALHDAARLGAGAAVVDRLALAAERVDGPVVATRAAHAEALVAGSAEALEAVGRRWEELGHSLFAAEADAMASACWRRAGDGRRAARAANRSAALADQCEGAVTPALKAAGGAALLTRRERQVADLAATDLPAKAIAERLGLSRRTVENHLQRAYTKLAVRNRAELAAALRGGP